MKRIPQRTIDRVLLYIRTLESLIKEKRHLISSGELSRITGISDVQIRKDVSRFGRVGTPRIGYKIEDLNRTLKDYLLQKGTVRVVLFGVGNLGTAILKYPGFFKNRIKIVAAFEKSPAKVNKKINGVKIYAVDKAPKVIKKLKIDLGIIAVPEDFSQEVADIMALSGLKGIVNFSPTTISIPKNVTVRDIDFSLEFLSLFCNIQRRK
jgi:redox-sensing transcriptional repressor